MFNMEKRYRNKIIIIIIIITTITGKSSFIYGAESFNVKFLLHKTMYIKDVTEALLSMMHK